MRKLHQGEVEIDEDLVRRLVTSRFPHLADQPLREVHSTGTVNAIFRLGDELCVRLPRLEKYADPLLKELTWLPRIAPSLSLRVPEPVAQGRPGCGYPFSWALYRWVGGESYGDDRIDDEPKAAEDLARFVTELRGVDRDGAPRGGRKPLRELDRATRAATGGVRAVTRSIKR